MFLAASDWRGFSGRVGRPRSRNSTTQVADLRAQFADLLGAARGPPGAGRGPPGAARGPPGAGRGPPGAVRRPPGRRSPTSRAQVAGRSRAMRVFISASG